MCKTQAADVRLVAVQVLLQLYSNPDNASPLQPFKARFLQRFQELAYDVDDRVAAKGVCGGAYCHTFTCLRLPHCHHDDNLPIIIIMITNPSSSS